MNTNNKIELIEEALLESVSGGAAQEFCSIDLCSIDLCDWPCFSSQSRKHAVGPWNNEVITLSIPVESKLVLVKKGFTA